MLKACRSSPRWCMIPCVQAIRRVSMALVVVAATASCGLKPDRIEAVAVAASTATPAPAASPATTPEPSPSLVVDPEPAPTPAPAQPVQPAQPATAAPAPSPTRAASEPCARRPPAAAAYGLHAVLSFPSPVVTSATEGTLTVRNVGTQTVHVSGKSYAGVETVEGQFLTSASASTSEYVPPVELPPGEQRSYRVHLVGQPCSGGRPDLDGRLPSGRYTVVGLLQVQEAPGLSVATDPVDVRYEAQ